MILVELLTQVSELLQHPEFKSFGDLQKHKYQMSKSKEDAEIKSLMYKGQIPLKKNKGKKLSKEAIEKGSISRKNWYKNPENYNKFIINLKKGLAKRMLKKRKNST